jgi:phosphoserine phosphatase
MMNQRKKILSLSAIGLDSPGLVSKITTRISEMKGNITDVEENCRRGLFSIFLVVDFSSSMRPTEEIVRSLKVLEMETDLKLIVRTCEEGEMAPGSEDQNYVVTILGLDRPGIIAGVSTFFHRYNVNIENCRMIARGRFFSMEMVISLAKMVAQPNLSPNENLESMKAGLKDLCAEMNQSVVIQSENQFKRLKKIVVFDVESTLIEASCLRDFIEKMLETFDLSDGGFRPIADRKDPFQVLIESAPRLKGLPVAELEKFSEGLALNPGVLELIEILKSLGFKIALLSSGFDSFMKKIFEVSGPDYAFANTLKVDENGIMTGELEEPIMTGKTRNELLELIMNMENISPEQVIAVGDDSTLSRLPEDTGLTIAFRPGDRSVRADGIFNGDQIINILYCMGLPKTELDKHLRKSPKQ